MKENSVSVIIPAYNVEYSLNHCIESVLAQNPKPKEIIVINDGSTDNTAKVAKSYRDKITYIEQENLGQGAARNAGLKIAKGEFIAFLDADDYWLPGFLITCVDFLIKNPKAAAVNTAYIIKKWGRKIIGPKELLGSNNDLSNSYMLNNF